jgi:hypothetical protein
MTANPYYYIRESALTATFKKIKPAHIADPTQKILNE